MSPFIYLALLVALIGVGPFAVLHVVEALHNRRGGVNFEPQPTGFADVKALLDTDAFEPRAPLERRRLVSVPAQQPRHLRAVRDDAMSEDEWERLMAVVHSIPEQREPGSAS